jgi:tRNA1(Val) A37 N6-methylase TrmN6
MSILLPSERFDDLLHHGLQIIQSDEVFSFSLDAVMLSYFCRVPARRGVIVDLCSGNGIIPLLLSIRSQAKIIGVEIQERIADMAMRSVVFNQLTERVHVHHADLRTFCHPWSQTESRLGLQPASVQLVTVNPPYLPIHTGDISDNRYLAGARHELDCTLEDVIHAASQLLKSGGKLAMVHRPSRLAKILQLMNKYELEPKRMRFVHPRIHAEANMVLIEASKHGKPDLRLLKPLIIHDEHGYHPEVAHYF